MHAHHDSSEDHAADLQSAMLAANIFKITMLGAVAFCGFSFYVMFTV